MVISSKGKGLEVLDSLYGEMIQQVQAFLGYYMVLRSYNAINMQLSEMVKDCVADELKHVSNLLKIVDSIASADTDSNAQMSPEDIESREAYVQQ